MEHVTIISQEAITRGLEWPPAAIACIAILILITCFILALIKTDMNVAVKGILITMILIPIMLITALICRAFFPVETGRYKYEGTLDPDMTIVEFEEFQQQYKDVRFEDSVWKWEDK